MTNKKVQKPQNAEEVDTPPKFNMESEHDGFQEELPFLGTSFQVPC